MHEERLGHHQPAELQPQVDQVLLDPPEKLMKIC